MRQEKLWFKAKSYGWGWTPITWQGWGVVAVYVVLITLNSLRLNSSTHSVSDFLLNLFPETFLLTAVLIAISYAKGEKPGWRWGNTTTVKTAPKTKVKTKRKSKAKSSTSTKESHD